MASLNVLAEAAKLVQYDEDGREVILHAEVKRYPNLDSPSSDNEPKRGRPGGSGSRETHNKLEKNRRAELKNFFQKLKHNIPKLMDKSKASNVSILTEAVHYIEELKAIDKQYENERIGLNRCRLCLEERIKMLKVDIGRMYLQNHLFAQVEQEQKRTIKPKKEMASVEVQANEHEIQAENLPLVFPRERIISLSKDSFDIKPSVDTSTSTKLPASLTKLQTMVFNVDCDTSTLKDFDPTIQDINFDFSKGISESKKTLKLALNKNIIAAGLRKRCKQTGDDVDRESGSEDELQICEDD